MVATDRVSAFDVILGGLPGKGALLTQISLYWFEQVAQRTRHHLVDDHAQRIAQLAQAFPELAGRSMMSEAATSADRGGGARLPVGLRLEALSANGQVV